MRKRFFLVTVLSVTTFCFLISPFVCLSANETTETATTTAATKEEIIQGILGELSSYYFYVPERHGKTYKIIIKDFALDDEETYAITDEINQFLIIGLSDVEYKPDRFFLDNEFSLDRVRKDLVEITRANGLQFEFTVPVRKEDLPGYKP